MIQRSEFGHERLCANHHRYEDAIEVQYEGRIKRPTIAREYNYGAKPVRLLDTPASSPTDPGSVQTVMRHILVRTEPITMPAFHCWCVKFLGINYNAREAGHIYYHFREEQLHRFDHRSVERFKDHPRFTKSTEWVLRLFRSYPYHVPTYTEYMGCATGTSATWTQKLSRGR